ncbi:MAG: YopX family protein [Flavobacteriales bacterium]
MMPKIKKYRLRLNTEIIGFADKTPHGFKFRGKPLWWKQGKPTYSEIDEFTTFKDINQQEIYELDIVTYTLDEQKRHGVILWEDKSKVFGIYDIENRMFIPLTIEELYLFQNDSVRVVSYLFKHPEIKKKIGLNNL